MGIFLKKILPVRIVRKRCRDVACGPLTQRFIVVVDDDPHEGVLLSSEHDPGICHETAPSLVVDNQRVDIEFLNFRNIEREC